MIGTSSIRLPAECGVRTTLSSARKGESGTQRFLAEHVEAGAGEPAAGERLDEVRLHHEVAARDIDERGARLHPAVLHSAEARDFASGVIGAIFG